MENLWIIDLTTPAFELLRGNGLYSLRARCVVIPHIEDASV